VKVLRQLVKLVKYKHDALFCTQERVEQAVMVLLEVRPHGTQQCDLHFQLTPNAAAAARCWARSWRGQKSLAKWCTPCS
jgi:hypothetical protein